MTAQVIGDGCRRMNSCLLRLLFQGLGKYGVLFYNAFIIIIPTVLASAYTGDLQKVSENIKTKKMKP